MARTFRNLIGGQWVASDSGDCFENRNPATGEPIGLFPRSVDSDLERAIESAERGFAAWRSTPAPLRGEVLRRTGDLLASRKEEIATVMTREMGKVLAETRGDVQEGIDTAYYAAAETRRLFGHTVPSELREKWAMSYRRPIGVCGLITTIQLPACDSDVEDASSGVRKRCHPEARRGRAAYGDASGRGSARSRPATRCHPTAPCAGEVVAAALVAHPKVPVISFTGSTATGSKIGEVCGRMHKRLSLEMGGKNAQVVMADGDLDLALDGVLWGAFGTTGQRCTATSRLLLQDPIHDRFMDMLIERTSKLRLGDGLAEATDVGPLINEQAFEKTSYCVGVAKAEGDEVMIGGHRADGPGLESGWFFQPTVLGGVEPGSRLAREEVFGPVLSVIRFDSLEDAIRINNEVEYGLSSAIYTRDVRAAFVALQEMDNGITYVNAPTIGAEAHMPFGGVKKTGNGHREGGWEVYDFYSETKVGYVDFSGRLQRAQIDTYE